MSQHMDALATANAVRLERTRQCRLLRAGETTLAQALAHPAMRTMTVFDLLVCQHRWGRDRALRALAHCDVFPISESKQAGSLTPRQRDSLIWWAER